MELNQVKRQIIECNEKCICDKLDERVLASANEHEKKRMFYTAAIESSVTNLECLVNLCVSLSAWCFSCFCQAAFIETTFKPRVQYREPQSTYVYAENTLITHFVHIYINIDAHRRLRVKVFGCICN